MKKLKSVAVILAAYNGTAFLEQQICSINNQVNVEVHIYLSVDLSSDGTDKLCAYLASENGNITILPYGDSFGGAAPNFFRLIRDVDFSGYDYVALADQDDIWLEDKLIMACTQIEKEDLAAYSSNVLAFWDDGRKKLINKAQPQRRYDYLFEAAGPGCSYVLRVEPLLKFKNLLVQNEDKIKKVALHDWLIYAFFRSKNYSWFIDPNYRLLYRQHDDNQVGVNKGWHAALKRIKLFHSGWYREQVMLISELVNFNDVDFNKQWQLLKNISQLRRRWQDRAILFVLVLVGLY